MNESLLELLVCPVTHSRLRCEKVAAGDAAPREVLVSEVGGLRYPVKDGLPVLLPDAAELPPGFKTLAEVKAAFGKRK